MTFNKEDKDFFLFLYGDPSQAFNSYLSPELLAKYTSLFNEAEKVCLFSLYIWLFTRICKHL